MPSSLAVVLVGPGLVGSTLLSQIAANKAEHAKRGLDLRVAAVANSRALLAENPAGAGVNLASDAWKAGLADPAAHRGEATLDAVASAVEALVCKDSGVVVCDCTASGAVAGEYSRWLRAGASVVTPNKKANSSSKAGYAELRELSRRGEPLAGPRYFYEATVGAGLPILSTLQSLIATGDKVKRIEGIFSGTLSYIFNEYDATKRFSDVVKEAKSLGYTEPDPRDDLDGMDVARKVTILARECGLDAIEDAAAVEKRSLVPAELKDVASIDEFMARLPDFDDAISEEARAADAEGKVLRCVGVVDCENGTVSVELGRYDRSHPFAQLKGSDNIVSFQTERYDSQPIIVRGPGAGAPQTAAGVYTDILAIGRGLGTAV